MNRIIVTLQQFESVSEISLNVISANPFQTNWYLQTFAKLFSPNGSNIYLGFFNEEKYMGYGAFEKIGNIILFLGMKKALNSQEVTDYGDITLNTEYKNYYTDVWNELKKWFAQNNTQTLQLDYVREDSHTFELYKNHAIEQQKAPFINLPKTWDEYLESLDRVDRKELKRKIRRLETVAHAYQCIDSPKQSDFEEFIRLHKLSSSQKQEFMTEEMKQFFWNLVTVEKKGWKTTFCFLQIEKKNVAALMSFENEAGVFAYNSGYDPSFNYYSVGLLLHAYKIKSAIEQGKKVYDFLRGTERYKYDLGGKDMELYKIEIPLEK